MGVVAMGGCSSSAFDPSGDAMVDLLTASLQEQERVDAAVAAWDQVEAGELDRAAVRRAFKDVAWAPDQPFRLRLVVVDLLLSDTTPEGEADSQRLARLMLPNERRRSMVALYAQTAAERGWTDVAPALVLAATNDTLLEDEDARASTERVELTALRSLFPGRPLEETVFASFLDPNEQPGEDRLRWSPRVRGAAWEVLSDLDPNGRSRRALLARPPATITPNPTAESLATIDNILAADRDLRVLPATAMELDWLGTLRDGATARERERNAVWWSEASSAMAGVSSSERDGLRLRHVEPVRWAAQNEPGWLGLSRDSLAARAAERLRGRERHRRVAEITPQGGPTTERFEDWTPRMGWGDLLALLVVDHAFDDPSIPDRIFELVELDRRDRRTEYGGAIEATETGFVATLYKPRNSDRGDDQRFVASDDLLRFSDRALAHFHMHVQNARNDRFAGPSDEDLDYAHRSGRTCVVLTSINGDRLGVDYYQPDGVVIDIGELRRDGSR